MHTLSAKLVVGDSVAFVQEECPFFLPFLAHSWHEQAPPDFAPRLYFPEAFCHLKRRNAQDLSELYVLGAILGVFLRFKARLKGKAINSLTLP